MVDNVLGMLIGAGLQGKDGNEAKGAMEGYLIEGALKVVAPLVVTYALGWGVQFLVRRGIHALTGDPDLKMKTPAAR